jgi:hypothetical protein
MLTKRAKQLMLGMSIGDGHVNKDGTSLQIAHSKKQLAFCKAKAELLGKELGRTIEVHEKNYNGFDTCRFQVSNRYFKFVRKWLYPNNKKTLKLSILRRLSNEAIALWYMDDGSLYSKKKDGIPHCYELVISCCTESIEEAQMICDFFLERYEVKMTVKRDKKRFSVRCGTRNARKLISVLLPYCLDGMEYKFSI